MIVHVSGREAMEQIQWARGRGMKIYAETCPQYLVLTADDLKGLNMDMSGAKYVCSPPPRDRASQDAIWRGTRGRRVPDLLLRPLPVPVRRRGRQEPTPKARTSFRWVPNGIPGVAARLPILFSEGVAKGRITLIGVRRADFDQPRQDVRALSPQGFDHDGADADIVLWDADKKVTLTQDLMQHGSDYTPYEGMEVKRMAGEYAAAGRADRRRGTGCRRSGNGSVPAPRDYMRPEPAARS